MTLTDINAHFSIPNILHFEQAGELIRAQITLPTCAATVYLHGAHLTHFQPTGHQPVLFLSSRSAFSPGKAIRGGVPICWPWFGARAEGKPGPMHGFARIEDWTVAAAIMQGDTLHLTLTLTPSEQAKSLGFDHFTLACELIFGEDQGRALTLRLSAANHGDTPLAFEEALHTYFQIGDIHQVEITGVESAAYIDKVDDFKVKQTPASPLQIASRVDRVFPNATAPVTIHDEANHRIITNTKTNSSTTVVWNPWTELTLTMPDLPADAWLHFVAVETANTGANAITLAPKAAHTMQTTVTIHPA